MFRQPVDNHSQYDESEHIPIVVGNFGNLFQTPMASDLVDHVLGCDPGRFVGQGRVKIGAAAEEQTREGDEGEGVQHSPCILEPLPGLLAAIEVVKHPNYVACKNDEAPCKEHVEHRQRHKNAQHPQSESNSEDEQRTTVNAPVFPKTVENHAYTVQSAPNHEVPGSAMPKTAQKHRVHAVDFGGDFLALFGLEVSYEAEY